MEAEVPHSTVISLRLFNSSLSCCLMFAPCESLPRISRWCPILLGHLPFLQGPEAGVCSSVRGELVLECPNSVVPWERIPGHIRPPSLEGQVSICLSLA